MSMLLLDFHTISLVIFSRNISALCLPRSFCYIGIYVSTNKSTHMVLSKKVAYTSTVPYFYLLYHDYSNLLWDITLWDEHSLQGPTVPCFYLLYHDYSQ